MCCFALLLCDQVVFRVFENMNAPPDAPERVRVELSFSNGGSVSDEVVGKSVSLGAGTGTGATQPLLEWN